MRRYRFLKWSRSAIERDVVIIPTLGSLAGCFELRGLSLHITARTSGGRGSEMYSRVDNPELLEWMMRTFKLAEQQEGNDDQLFGPYRIKGRPLHVRYRSAVGAWEIVEHTDDYFAAYHQRRDEVAGLADEHRGLMGRAEFVRFLIQAAIATGINRRAGILEAVELAANHEAVQCSIDSGRDYSSIPTEFDEAFITATLNAGRGARRGRGLWWVDSDKTYRLYG
ncbi:hypothetical protein [Sphingomonas faeni]|uniref:hypothetical protein n=1 Tax=Sphingomonas faeni TaxID=185950 RepID=UPI003348D4BA